MDYSTSGIDALALAAVVGVAVGFFAAGVRFALSLLAIRREV